MPEVRAMIRVATEADVPAIFEVRTSVRENHLSLEGLAARGITPASVAEMIRTTMRAWVAEVDGEVVAFVPSVSAILFVTELIIATLLLAQTTVFRSRALTVLAAIFVRGYRGSR